MRFRVVTVSGRALIRPCRTGRRDECTEWVADGSTSVRVRRRAAEYRSGSILKACYSREAEGMRYKVSSGYERGQSSGLLLAEVRRRIDWGFSRWDIRIWYVAGTGNVVNFWMKDIYMGFNACPGFTPKVCLGLSPKLLTLSKKMHMPRSVVSAMTKTHP
jgi:hypothetical protein